MEAQYKTGDGRIVFKISGDSVKDIFGGIAEVQEIFEQSKMCGCCESINLRFRIRESKTRDNKACKYYEHVCGDCHARFEYGQTADGQHLFPKRKDEQGAWKDNNGWTKYQRAVE